MTDSIRKRTVLHFFCSTASGTITPALVLAVIALCFGAVPPLSILASTLPLSLMFALLAAAAWPILAREDTATRWFVSLFIPTGMAFVSTALLNILGGPQSRFDLSFIIFNVIWALIASGSTALVYHRLTRQ